MRDERTYWVGGAGVKGLVETLQQLLASDGEEKKRNFGLTKRELDVVGTIVAGYQNKEIAQKFSISEDTVKHHLTNIFNKVGVSNRLELALFAVHHKLVQDNLNPLAIDTLTSSSPGPAAGAVAALRLARAGVRVILCDRATSP